MSCDNECVEIAKQCLKDEATAIMQQINYIDQHFVKACDIILQCKGKVIVTGVGKSGHIGAKIAATLASTGTPSFFLNPLDAFHGDLGACTEGDVVIAISNSGQTDELLRLLPTFQAMHLPIIGMSADDNSLLAKHSTIHLLIPVKQEAEPLGLAPTTSTTVTLAVGDALACSLMKARHFKATDFARNHPGGSLGKRLLTKVGDVMFRAPMLPVVAPDMKLGEAVMHVSKGRLGLCVKTDKDGHVEGIITDGDIRRAMEKMQNKFFSLTVADIMTRKPKSISEDTKVSTAQKMMQDNKIHALLVVDSDGKLIGIVDSFRVMI